MGFLSGIYQTFFADLVRVYALLNTSLRLRIWLLTAAMFLSALFEVISLSVLSFLGMSIAAPEATANHPLFAKLFSVFPALRELAATGPSFVLFVSLLLLSIFIIKNIFAYIVICKNTQLGEEISIFIAKCILHKYFNMSYLWHISADSSKVFQALSNQASLGGLIIQMLNIYIYIITSLALFATLLSATPSIILCVVFTTALVTYVLYMSIKNRLDRASITAAQKAQEQTRALMSAMHGIREVLIYRQQSVFFEAYMDATLAGASARRFMAKAPPMPAWILECLGISVVPLSVWLLVLRGDADMGTMAAVVSLVMVTSWRILPMVNRVLSSLIAIRSLRGPALICLEQLELILHHPTVELPDPDPNYAFRRTLALEKIAFRYPDTKADVLQDITLTVRKGEQVGFIGLSGAGKSTIVGVISGLLTPTSGRILVDGEPLSPAGLAAYMQRVGYVSQSPYIMGGTIAENVSFSQWGKPIEEERVREACRMAALDMVDAGDGIYTVLSAGGGGLSGGQAQRVSIARALFTHPDILILDESTSSLDQLNEEKIMKTIVGYKGIITTILVAHRLTTLKHCDRIFWLENGRLVDQGPAGIMLAKYQAALSSEGKKCCAP